MPPGKSQSGECRPPTLEKEEALPSRLTRKMCSVLWKENLSRLAEWLERLVNWESA